MGFIIFYILLWRPDGFSPQNMMLSSFAILLVALQGIALDSRKEISKRNPNLTFPIIASMVNGTFYLLSVNKPTLGFLLNLLNFTVLPVLHSSVTEEHGYFDWYRYVSCHKNLKKEVLAFVSVSLVWVLMTIVLGRLSIHDLMFKYIEWMEIFAAPLMLCYNGERGKGQNICSTLFIQVIFIYFTPCQLSSIDDMIRVT